MSGTLDEATSKIHPLPLVSPQKGCLLSTEQLSGAEAMREDAGTLSLTRGRGPGASL